ncbi:MAG: DUF853 family protein, partial [Clostridia bacterium]|nr:DUF853 family protein [Clostridia bacterium]
IEDERRQAEIEADELYGKYEDNADSESAYEIIHGINEEAAAEKQAALEAKEAEKKAALEAKQKAAEEKAKAAEERAKEKERKAKEKEKEARKKKIKNSAAGKVASSTLSSIGREMGRTLFRGLLDILKKG